jgi:dihydrofolate reductase
MRKVHVFEHVSLDGFFTDAKGEIGWLHQRAQDPEWEAFVRENASSNGVLVFGRKTYDMMAGWWPTPQAAKSEPVVAERMNALEKVVFSKTLERAEWSHTTLLKGDPAAEVKRLKAETGNDLVVMGSGTIVSQLAQDRLVDEYQLVFDPIVLGKGRTLFEGVTERIELKRLRTREFRNGNLVVHYAPA